MYQQEYEYYDFETRLVSHLVYDDSYSDKRPLVLIAPAFEGRTQFVIDKAEQLAKQGYAALALDVYGDAKTGNSIEENVELMKPFQNDRALLRQRMLVAYEAAKKIEVVDTSKMAAIGFCFGGMCVLDLARAGADLKGVVSFHGVFAAPKGLTNEEIKAKVLMLHGHKDPMTPPEQADQIIKELDEANVDWQLLFYGNAMHAFTDPKATEVDIGRKYDPVIAKRSWRVMEGFLEEIFE